MKIMHSEKYTLPIVAPLQVCEEWQVFIDQARDPEFTFVRKNQVAYRTEDSFDVRSDFLSLRTPEDALHFFKRYGPFQYRPSNQSGTKRSGEVQSEPIKWSQLRQAQHDFKEGLMAEGIPVAKAWLYNYLFGQPLALELQFRAVVPELSARSRSHRANGLDDAAIAKCFDVVDALRASIFLSRMRGFRWSHCERQGCEEIFEQKTKRQKLYCSESCAHLQAVNDYNARQKKKMQKPKP